MKAEAFGGQVIFEIGGYMLLGLVVEDALKGIAQPQPDSDTATLVDSLSTFLARTRSITFMPGENAPEAVTELETFWKAVQAHGSDYGQIWTLFLQTLGGEAHNAWWDAIRAANQSPVHAPADVQPEADGTAVDADFLGEKPKTRSSKK